MRVAVAVEGSAGAKSKRLRGEREGAEEGADAVGLERLRVGREGAWGVRVQEEAGDRGSEGCASTEIVVSDMEV